MAIRALLAGLAVVVAAPVVHAAATPPSRSHELGPLEVVAQCMTAPFSRFDVSAANRAEPGAGSARIDVYFGKGTRLSFLPGVFPANFFHIAGRHAWKSVESWNPYTGFGVQVAVHAAGSYRVVYVLTVHGVRHRYAWACSAR